MKIEEILQIEVKMTEDGKGFQADAKVMPGIPPIGYHWSAPGAVLDLLNKLYDSDVYYHHLERNLF